ncbi:MAG: tetratricopeptide repeat protein [Burkholderiaceae bacterium]|nr:tetratricopeptide repeat protein [Burkholderiaceae bacterium]
MKKSISKTRPDATNKPHTQPRCVPRWGWLVFALIALGLLLTSWSLSRVGKTATAITATPLPSSVLHAGFVGGKACISCHAAAAKDWSGSHHDLAMQIVSEQTVLGDFNQARFNYAGITSTFFKRDGKFFARTDGPDGKLADFEIRYAFGISPLQQYLIELPGGKLQALSIAWDSRIREAGGQRWFHLYPGEKVDHKDVLHWTRRSQNWNHMCAECHSTDLHKNYDAGTQRFNTTWKDINVSCEACHGPGSNHLAWVKRAPGWETIHGKGLEVLFDERRNAQWTIDPASGNAQRSAARVTDKEVETCARCHSRRSQLSEDFVHGRPLMDTHQPAALQRGLYHADGQIQDEVYEYASFKQSKMFHKGVTCSDCHNPHTLKLRANGSAVCMQCHAAVKYTAPAHHRHKTGSAGADCLACHMPTQTYMGVDVRHDHSFRVPRPDQSVSLGTPNACTACHTDKSASWAAAQVRGWLGRDANGFQTFAPALAAARNSAPNAEAGLLALLDDPLQPTVVRATAAEELGAWLSPVSVQALARALNDPDPQVRGGALAGIANLPLEQRWQLAAPLLHDDVRMLRIEAAGQFAGVPVERMTAEQRSDMERASAEYLAAQKQNADIPEGRANLGNFYAARGEFALAEAAYQSAIKLDPDWIPAYVNLADLLRQMQRDPEAEQTLRAGLERHPDAAALNFSLGLLQVRAKNLNDAIGSLKRAAKQEPGNAHYSYVYVVALHSAGQAREAQAVLGQALKRIPGDRSLLDLKGQLAAAH